MGNVLLNLAVDFNRPLLVAQGRHHVDEFLQEQVAGGQQQVDQDHRLACAHQEGSDPVKDGTGAGVVFDLHRGRCLLCFFLFLLARTQVFNRRRRQAEVIQTGKGFLHPSPQFGHVLWRFIHPRQSRATEFEETNPDGGRQETKHEHGGERRRNVQVGQPTDEWFQCHSGDTGQDDRQDNRPGKVEEGDRAKHNQDALHGCRLGHRRRAGWSGRRRRFHL